MHSRLLVLYYHQLVESMQMPWISALKGHTCTYTVFENQMQYISNHPRLEFVSIKNYVEGNTDPKKTSVCVTFDDGHRSFLHVLPLFEKLNISPVLFVNSGCVQSGIPPWPQELLLFFEYVRDQRKENLSLELRGRKWNLSANDSKDLWQRAYTTISFLLVSFIETREREIFLAELFARYGFCATRARETELFRKLEMLSWKDLNALGSRVEVGGHTCTHLNLSLADSERVVQEIADDKFLIEKNLGRISHSFAAPFGEASSDVQAVVEKVGYRFIFWGETGLEGTDKSVRRFRRLHAGIEGIDLAAQITAVLGEAF